MIIKKFNENIEANETWTQAKFDKIAAMKDYIYTEENKLLPLLNKYLILNVNLIEEEEEDDFSSRTCSIDSYEFLDNPKYKMNIFYFPNKEYEYNNETQEVTLTNEQYKDLLIFLENPETYSDVKKYNL